MVVAAEKQSSMYYYFTDAPSAQWNATARPLLHESPQWPVPQLRILHVHSNISRRDDFVGQLAIVNASSFLLHITPRDIVHLDEAVDFRTMDPTVVGPTPSACAIPWCRSAAVTAQASHARCASRSRPADHAAPDWDAPDLSLSDLWGFLWCH
ncbi:hypothetical protein A0H81_03509 [Grifola frondosa]|uniref:Uncharacterized protein n=1 Tax=Grifola frondosa TaxID=5627 RepID=A0A1C7MGQ8_GRIFR|nr:hypothetical protein A0H81_03509 [Grifola frondosa]